MSRGGTFIQKALYAIIACLLALHSFSFLNISAASAGYGSASDQGALIEIAFAKCSPQTDDGAPSPAHHDPSESCALCSVGASEEAYLAAVYLASVVYGPISYAAVPVHYFERPDLSRPRHAGWGSSWSAQAPPRA